MKGQSGTTVGIFAVLAVLVTVAVAGVTISENRQLNPPLEVVIDMPPPATQLSATQLSATQLSTTQPPATQPVVEQAAGPAPEPEAEPDADGGAPSAADQQFAEALGTAAELAGEGESSPQVEGGDAQRLPDPPATDVQEPATGLQEFATDVQEIDTAAGSAGSAGSERVDDMPPQDPIPESVDVRTETPEAVAAPPVDASSGPIASNETTDAEVESAGVETTGVEPTGVEPTNVETRDEPPSRVVSNSLAATIVEPPMEERPPLIASTFDGPEPAYDAPESSYDVLAPLSDAVVISRRSNLRSEPGPDSPVLAKLNPGQRVFRLDDKPVLGYYRVSSEGVVGWIWWLNVSDGPGGNVAG